MLSVQMCILLWICLLKCKSTYSALSSEPLSIVQTFDGLLGWLKTQPNMRFCCCFFCAYPIIIDIIMNRFPSTELLLNYTKVEKYFYTA